MDCRDIEKFVYVYLDEEFEQRESLEFEGHLEGCPSCLKYVRFEENYLQGLREKIQKVRAPEQLRKNILSALSEETARTEQVASQRWEFSAGPWWFSGAFATGIMVVLGWQVLLQNPSQLPMQTPATEPASLLATASSPTTEKVSSASTLRSRDVVNVQPVSTERPLAESTNQGRSPFGSLVASRVVQHAMDKHEAFPQHDIWGDKQAITEVLRKAHWKFDPPIPESRVTRLLGARIVRHGLVPQVIYTYDHMGRRLTAVQSLLPKSWGRLTPNFSVDTQQDRTVVTYQGEDESVVTSIVCEGSDCELSFIDARRRSE